MRDPLAEHFLSVHASEVPDSVLRGDFRRAAARQAKAPALGLAIGLGVALLVGYLPGPPDQFLPSVAARQLADLVAKRDLGEQAEDRS